MGPLLDDLVTHWLFKGAFLVASGEVLGAILFFAGYLFLRDDRQRREDRETHFRE